MKLFNFSDYIDEDTNFTALTFQLNSKERVIAYRGTTDSVIGWRENFNLAIGKNMPSQILAYKYLLQSIDGSFDYYLTGHSKGAKLAVYSALQLEVRQSNSIKAIYAFDGPGFDTMMEYANHPIYTSQKVHHYIANFSIVGLMLNHTSKPTVIQCNSMSFLHHLTNLWEVDGTKFKRSEQLSESSKLFQYVSMEWIKVTTVEDRKRYINDLFDILIDAGIQSFNQINNNHINIARKILKQYRQLDEETVDFIKNKMR
ncbi:Mbeg1-like protein [Aerococcaceae bacterium WGS1372]